MTGVNCPKASAKDHFDFEAQLSQKETKLTMIRVRLLTARALRVPVHLEVLDATNVAIILLSRMFFVSMGCQHESRN